MTVIPCICDCMYPYKIRGHNWEKTCKHALFLFLNTTPSQPLSHSRCLVQIYWLLSWTGKHNLVNWTRAMTSKSGIHLSFIELYAMCMDDHLWDDPHKFQIVPPLKGNRYTWWLGEKKHSERFNTSSTEKGGIDVALQGAFWGHWKPEWLS